MIRIYKSVGRIYDSSDIKNQFSLRNYVTSHCHAVELPEKLDEFMCKYGIEAS